MNYPLITEYIDAIRSAEDNFDKLTNLRPVLDSDGQPVMSSGNFAVVFKMEDSSNGKHYAVKCFLKEQEKRAESYRLISDELNFLQSGFLVTIKYLNKELFVDSNIASVDELPVLLMDWVEGETLDRYIRNNIHDKYQLSLLAYQFSRLSMWLLAQPFAHGDLKPDNIIVREDGTLALVDYDGMYVPAMKGEKARELGSPDFRHPSRTEDIFDEHIDDFSIASIMLSLKAIAIEPEFLEKYGTHDRLLLSEENYRAISECSFLNKISNTKDSELRKLFSLFNIAVIEGDLSKVSFRLFRMHLPQKDQFSTEQLLIPYRKGDKWGFCNINKQIVIALQYDRTYRFSEGLALVKLNEKLGFIDKSGKEVIPLKYDWAGSFSEGFAVVQLNWKWGCIDKSGNEVIPLIYDRIKLLENIVIVEIGINLSVKNKDGNELFSAKNYVKVEEFSKGILKYQTRSNKYGLVDEYGKNITLFDYSYISTLEDGLASVKLNGKWGYIDKTGEEIIPCKYDNSYGVKCGLPAVMVDGKWGFINRDGERVTPFKYDYLLGSGCGLIGVMIKGKYGFINTKGVEIVPLKYDYISVFYEGLSAVKLKGKWGYINKKGEEVIPLKYREAERFSEGLAAVRLNFKWGVINKNGVALTDFKYHKVGWRGRFSEGLIDMSINNKWGSIDKTGKEITPFKYDNVYSFSEDDGLRFVSLNGKDGYIDKNGKEFFEE